MRSSALRRASITSRRSAWARRTQLWVTNARIAPGLAASSRSRAIVPDLNQAAVVGAGFERG